ncbi:hypothetical protein JCM9279_002275 [Rhodotorula babjevae]
MGLRGLNVVVFKARPPAAQPGVTELNPDEDLRPPDSVNPTPAEAAHQAAAQCWVRYPDVSAWLSDLAQNSNDPNRLFLVDSGAFYRSFLRHCTDVCSDRKGFPTLAEAQHEVALRVAADIFDLVRLIHKHFKHALVLYVQDHPRFRPVVKHDTYVARHQPEIIRGARAERRAVSDAPVDPYKFSAKDIVSPLYTSEHYPLFGNTGALQLIVAPHEADPYIAYLTRYFASLALPGPGWMAPMRRPFASTAVHTYGPDTDLTVGSRAEHSASHASPGRGGKIISIDRRALEQDTQRWPFTSGEANLIASCYSGNDCGPGLYYIGLVTIIGSSKYVDHVNRPWVSQYDRLRKAADAARQVADAADVDLARARARRHQVDTELHAILNAKLELPPLMSIEDNRAAVAVSSADAAARRAADAARTAHDALERLVLTHGVELDALALKPGDRAAAAAEVARLAANPPPTTGPRVKPQQPAAALLRVQQVDALALPKLALKVHTLQGDEVPVENKNDWIADAQRQRILDSDHSRTHANLIYPTAYPGENVAEHSHDPKKQKDHMRFFLAGKGKPGRTDDPGYSVRTFTAFSKESIPVDTLGEAACAHEAVGGDVKKLDVKREGEVPPARPLTIAELRRRVISDAQKAKEQDSGMGEGEEEDDQDEVVDGSGATASTSKRKAGRAGAKKKAKAAKGDGTKITKGKFVKRMCANTVIQVSRSTAYNRVVEPSANLADSPRRQEYGHLLDVHLVAHQTELGVLLPILNDTLNTSALISPSHSLFAASMRLDSMDVFARELFPAVIKVGLCLQGDKMGPLLKSGGGIDDRQQNIDRLVELHLETVPDSKQADETARIENGLHDISDEQLERCVDHKIPPLLLVIAIPHLRNSGIVFPEKVPFQNREEEFRKIGTNYATAARCNTLGPVKAIAKLLSIDWTLGPADVLQRLASLVPSPNLVPPPPHSTDPVRQVLPLLAGDVPGSLSTRRALTDIVADALISCPLHAAPTAGPGAAAPAAAAAAATASGASKKKTTRKKNKDGEEVAPHEAWRDATRARFFGALKGLRRPLRSLAAADDRAALRRRTGAAAAELESSAERELSDQLRETALYLVDVVEAVARALGQGLDGVATVSRDAETPETIITWAHESKKGRSVQELARYMLCVGQAFDIPIKITSRGSSLTITHWRIRSMIATYPLVRDALVLNLNTLVERINKDLEPPPAVDVADSLADSLNLSSPAPPDSPDVVMADLDDDDDDDDEEEEEDLEPEGDGDLNADDANANTSSRTNRPGRGALASRRKKFPGKQLIEGIHDLDLIHVDPTSTLPIPLVAVDETKEQRNAAWRRMILDIKFTSRGDGIKDWDDAAPFAIGLLYQLAKPKELIAHGLVHHTRASTSIFYIDPSRRKERDDSTAKLNSVDYINNEFDEDAHGPQNKKGSNKRLGNWCQVGPTLLLLDKVHDLGLEFVEPIHPSRKPGEKKVKRKPRDKVQQGDEAQHGANPPHRHQPPPLNYRREPVYVHLDAVSRTGKSRTLRWNAASQHVLRPPSTIKHPWERKPSGRNIHGKPDQDIVRGMMGLSPAPALVDKGDSLDDDGDVEMASSTADDAPAEAQRIPPVAADMPINSVFVGVDSGERNSTALSATAPHTKQVVHTQIRASQFVERDAVDAAVTRRESANWTLTQVASRIPPSEELYGARYYIDRLIATNPVRLELIYKHKVDRQSRLQSIVDRAADTLVRTAYYFVGEAPDPADGVKVDKPHVTLFVGHKLKGARSSFATGANRTELVTAALIASLQSKSGITLTVVRLNEYMTSQTCPNTSCRISRSNGLNNYKDKETMQYLEEIGTGYTLYRLLQCKHCKWVFNRDVVGALNILRVGIFAYFFVGAAPHLFRDAVEEHLGLVDRKIKAADSGKSRAEVKKQKEEKEAKKKEKEEKAAKKKEKEESEDSDDDDGDVAAAPAARASSSRARASTSKGERPLGEQLPHAPASGTTAPSSSRRHTRAATKALHHLQLATNSPTDSLPDSSRTAISGRPTSRLAKSSATTQSTSVARHAVGTLATNQGSSSSSSQLQQGPRVVMSTGVEPGCVGIYTPEEGQTCYLDATVQALARSIGPQFIAPEALHDGHAERLPLEYELVQALHAILVALSTVTVGKSLDGTRLVQAVRAFTATDAYGNMITPSPFNRERQHDPHELLTSCIFPALESLVEGALGAKSLITGYRRDETTCTVCSKAHEGPLELFRILTLDFPPRRTSPVTVMDLIQHHLAPEPMLVHCDSCKLKDQPSVRRPTFRSLPPHLIIQLSRSAGPDKIEERVEYPLELELESSKDGSTTYSRYKLKAVVQHHGQSVHFGHYTTIARGAGDRSWYKYNGANVSRLTEQDALSSSDAYVLYYERLTPS